MIGGGGVRRKDEEVLEWYTRVVVLVPEPIKTRGFAAAKATGRPATLSEHDSTGTGVPGWGCEGGWKGRKGRLYGTSVI